MAINKSVFMQNLKALRQDRRMSLRDLAGYLDCSYGTVNKYEKGSAEPSFDMLNRLAKFFGVSVGSLLGEVSAPNTRISMIPLVTSSQALALAEKGLQDLGQAMVQGNGENNMDYLPTSKYHDCFALLYQGRSMEPVFTSGDVLFVDPSKTPTGGSFAAVAVEKDTEVRIRKYREMVDEKGQKYIQMVPMNQDCAPVDSRLTSFKILGCVTACTHEYR